MSCGNTQAEEVELVVLNVEQNGLLGRSSEDKEGRKTATRDSAEHKFEGAEVAWHAFGMNGLSPLLTSQFSNSW